MRLRTQSEIMQELRETDPNTSFTPYALRRMVLSGQIPVVRSGRRMLIDADRIEDYLTYLPPAQEPVTGTIRKLSA